MHPADVCRDIADSGIAGLMPVGTNCMLSILQIMLSMPHKKCNFPGSAFSGSKLNPVTCAAHAALPCQLVVHADSSVKWGRRQQRMMMAAVTADIPEGQGSGALHGSMQAAAASNKAGEACQLPNACGLCCQCITCQHRAVADQWQHAALGLRRVYEELNQVWAVPLQSTCTHGCANVSEQ